MTGLFLMLQRQNIITNCVCVTAENCELHSFVLLFGIFIHTQKQNTSAARAIHVCLVQEKKRKTIPLCPNIVKAVQGVDARFNWWGKGECKWYAWQKISASVTRLHGLLMEKLFFRGFSNRASDPQITSPHTHHHSLPPLLPHHTRTICSSITITSAPLSPPSSISPPIQFSPHSFLSRLRSDGLLSSVSNLSPSSLAFSSSPVSNHKIQADCCHTGVCECVFFCLHKCSL